MEKNDEQPLEGKGSGSVLDDFELEALASELTLERLVRVLEHVEDGLHAAGGECRGPGCMSEVLDCVQQERKLHRELEVTVNRLLGLLRAAPVMPSWKDRLPAAGKSDEQP